MRPIRLNTCNFCCIYLLNKFNNKNIKCRHTSIKRCCTQGLHISFQYFAVKVLIWKLFMLLVESPFAGWFFPFKRFIEKVLIWSVFKLLVFLFAGCLFLEIPSFSGFSGQFERKFQNLEWGPLDLTLATFAVFTCKGMWRCTALFSWKKGIPRVFQEHGMWSVFFHAGIPWVRFFRRGIPSSERQNP